MLSLVFVVESKHGPADQWKPWRHLAPFAYREDAIRQKVHLETSEPLPTRSWQISREFRVVERPAGCPRCFQDAVGALCEWHKAKEMLGAEIAPPRAVQAAKPVVPSPRVRRSPKSGFGPDAVAILRRHHAGGAE